MSEFIASYNVPKKSFSKFKSSITITKLNNPHNQEDKNTQNSLAKRLLSFVESPNKKKRNDELPPPDVVHDDVLTKNVSSMLNFVSDYVQCSCALFQRNEILNVMLLRKMLEFYNRHFC